MPLGKTNHGFEEHLETRTVTHYPDLHCYKLSCIYAKCVHVWMYLPCLTDCKLLCRISGSRQRIHPDLVERKNLLMGIRKISKFERAFFLLCFYGWWHMVCWCITTTGMEGMIRFSSIRATKLIVPVVMNWLLGFLLSDTGYVWHRPDMFQWTSSSDGCMWRV